MRYAVVVGEQKTLEEGGELYGKTVYLFRNSERERTSFYIFLCSMLLSIHDSCLL
jgi:hypothetical protein